MSLDSSLSIASGGLANINAQFALISQNVANAATPGYSVEVGNQRSVTYGGVGAGVHAGPASLQVDRALQASLVQQNALVGGQQTTQRALQAIDSVLGAPDAGTDLGSLLGKLRDSFSTLLTDPGNQTQQSAVVSSAATLAAGINALGAAYSAQRQAAQNNLGAAVDTLNSTLATIGQLSDSIIALRPTRQSTADLENQRNAAVQTLSSLFDVRTVEQANGDLTVFTPTGMTLPTSNGRSPLLIGNASTLPGSYYPGGGIPGITLRGQDVTSQMAGGQIGADIALRDTIMPTRQAELDEFSMGLSKRFAAQGLTLFTDPAGNLPVGGGNPVQAGYVGYASTIQVNPAVTGDPSLIRDGTNATANFTPNPSGGPAGFTTLIANVANYTFGSQSQGGVGQPALNTSGLGASGDLAASFTDTGTSLSALATRLIASQARDSATVTSNLTTDQAMQSGLNARISAISGVNMDSEMSHMLSLQNAYGANAKVIGAVQSMYAQLLQMIQ